MYRKGHIRKSRNAKRSMMAPKGAVPFSKRPERHCLWLNSYNISTPVTITLHNTHMYTHTMCLHKLHLSVTCCHAYPYQWLEVPYDSLMSRTKNRPLVRHIIR